MNQKQYDDMMSILKNIAGNVGCLMWMVGVVLLGMLFS